MVSPRTHLEHTITPIAHRSYFAEFISTFLSVFAAIGATMSSRKMMPHAGSDSSSLVAIAIANAFDGSLNCCQHLRGACESCHHLWNGNWWTHYYSHGHFLMDFPNAWICHGLPLAKSNHRVTVPIHAVPQEMTRLGATILEGVMTFALVFIVYASSDSRKGAIVALGNRAL